MSALIIVWKEYTQYISEMRIAAALHGRLAARVSSDSGEIVDVASEIGLKCTFGCEHCSNHLIRNFLLTLKKIIRLITKSNNKKINADTIIWCYLCASNIH